MIWPLLIVFLTRAAVAPPEFKPSDLTAVRAGQDLYRAKVNQGRDLAPPADELKAKGLHHGTANVLRRN